MNIDVKNGSTPVELATARASALGDHLAVGARVVDKDLTLWSNPAVIVPNNFQHKSLSNWALNFLVGCWHGCNFCYVPSAATIKQAPKLAEFGVSDPDAEWGQYAILRPWDESAFIKSLRAAEATPAANLARDGNRAVIICSTTDAYQLLWHPDVKVRFELNKHLEFMVRRSLELIRDQSTLNVRVLARSPLAKRDFDLFKSFGPRLMFGMSLPTLRNDLASVYEPHAPAPTKRLETLRAAVDAGLFVFVAMAPSYPECDSLDLWNTIEAISVMNPLTLFHEPINIRAKNVERIQNEAAKRNVALKSFVFDSRETWQRYALDALQTVERLARAPGLEHIASPLA